MDNVKVVRVQNRKTRAIDPIPWAEPAVSVAVSPAAYYSLRDHKTRKTNRSFLAVEHPFFQVSEPSVFDFPFEHHQERRPKRKFAKQEITHNPEHPQTDAGYYTGYYPANQPVFSNKHSRKVRHLTVEPLDRFQQPPAPEQPLSSFIPPWEHRRYGHRKFVSVLEINSYPETPEAPESSTWTIQANSSDVWTEQSNSVDTWTEA